MPQCSILQWSSADPVISNEEGMLAACYHKHGKPEKVVHVETVKRPPPPSPNQLLIRVHAAALNPVDWKTGQGEHAALLNFQWPRVYGFDFSGEVVSVGDVSSTDEQAFSVGDKVFGMIRGLPQANKGTLAEFVLVDADICARCPSAVPHVGCASVPLVAITAVKMLRQCGLKEQAPGQIGPRVFVTGGAGGLGTIAIQLALKMFGASFVATTASPGAKTDLCTELGATRVVNYREEDFVEVLGDSDDAKLFDAVLDCTGEAKRCVPLLKHGGGLVSVLAGPTQDCLITWLEEGRPRPDEFKIGGLDKLIGSSVGGSILQVFSGARALRKACEARGATFGHVIGSGSREIMEKVAALLAAGEIQPVVDKVYRLEQAVEAIQYQASGRAAGKVVVAMPASETKSTQSFINGTEG